MVDALQQRRKKSGAAWENAVSDECEVLRIEGRALVTKTPEAHRVIGRQGAKLLAVPARKSAPDFAGLFDGGRAVAFDAKKSEAPTRFPLPKQDSPKGWFHQLEYLWNFHELGGVSFLYVEHFPGPHAKRRRLVFPVVRGLVAGVDPRVVRSLEWRLQKRYQVAGDASWWDWCVDNIEEWA